ncbi:hypothetical protein [Vibrio cholerae]|uniref:Uncharacterized protein n=1 Tax=Vibrio cholerae TaxID=666 RepID=A0A655XV21_VIBCL|nr:hypothetical protein [Vibrio cholerae]AFC58274.1 hypothetical protein O3Y_06980 [Vibrio cholerae IEC224]AUR69693.1 hypothetical protein C1H56_06235 [Vibrio cholerae]AVL22655.1 hypothetical protein VCA1552_01232 [Vibrio cholerae]AWB73976.1 hypothetical protein A1552VC_01234 [Vibrio cholerae]EHU0373408.1 hypothetical protein [Vibrio cholerae]
MDFNVHTTVSKDPIIVLKEKKSKFELLNENRINVSKVKVDGGIINCALKKRCDWILSYNKTNDYALFIELKGCDLDEAIKQLKATLDYTQDVYRNHVRQCFAVTTSVPKFGTSAQRKSRDFYHKTRSTLTIKNTPVKHGI